MAVPVRALLPMLLLTTQQGLGSTFAHSSRRRDEWGPAHLQETCEDGICHRYGKMSAPLDHEDPSEGEWELVYFVNSDYWDPVAKPGAPIFVNMGYGATDVEGYTAGALFRIDGATFARGFPGATPELAAELGALIINVPNRYYGCNTARAGRDEGTCPTSLGSIPAGEDGVLEAHERLRYLSLTAVVDDIALVARETVTTYARDWGMQLMAGAGAGTGGVRGRAPNQPSYLVARGPAPPPSTAGCCTRSCSPGRWLPHTRSSPPPRATTTTAPSSGRCTSSTPRAAPSSARTSCRLGTRRSSAGSCDRPACSAIAACA
jgi:hypothetical protein